MLRWRHRPCEIRLGESRHCEMPHSCELLPGAALPGPHGGLIANSGLRPMRALSMLRLSAEPGIRR